MHLRNDMRQKNTQKNLDFNTTPTGEARTAGGEATESFSARHAPENPETPMFLAHFNTVSKNGTQNQRPLSVQ
jgi:hypothetical protein